VGKTHGRLVFDRRAHVLASALSQWLPSCQRLLDVGCGNGMIAHLIQQQRETLTVEGVEFMARPECLVSCRDFDGLQVPLPDGSVDVAMFVDVLHHAADARRLLADTVRVTRRYVLIKDHLCENSWDHLTLKFMDWVGNRPHGVVLPYSYRSRAQWDQMFTACSLKVVQWTEDIPLYPRPFHWIFGRHLHFVALLEKTQPTELTSP